MVEFNEKTIKKLIRTLEEQEQEELKSITSRIELKAKYFYFVFNKKYAEPYIMLADFKEAIQILEKMALKWEQMVYGSVLSVDRVKYYYLNPLYKEFIEKLLKDYC